MKREYTFCVLYILPLFLQGHALNIESLFVPCSVKDAALSGCVKETGQKLIPLLSRVDVTEEANSCKLAKRLTEKTNQRGVIANKGAPDLKIPPLDPMEVESASFGQHTKDINIGITYSNIIQKGISQVVIEDAKIDMDKGVMEFHFFYPIFIWEADYTAKGNLYDFHVDGSGRANITVWDTRSTLTIHFHIEDDHLREDEVEVGYEFDKIYLDYTSLRVNDDDELSASAGTYINENSREILNGFKPDLEKFYGTLLKKNLKGFFDTVPYSSLFKDV